MNALASLIKQHKEGYALQQSFYTDNAIYEKEIDSIFLKSWLYAGHCSEVPARGDYFLFNIAGESVIIVRDNNDDIRALMNVCRHRGSRVCREESGNCKLFSCPYHGWTYQLDGSLRGATHTPAGFDKSLYGLKKISCRIFHGMIFINFDPDPVSFAPVEEDMDECLRPYDLANAKVAWKQSYPIDANWKLAVENYCECYHCIPAHVEYSKFHGRSRPEKEVRELLEKVMEKSAQAGLSTCMFRKHWNDAGATGIDRGYDRYPLFDGAVTGSRDGKPVAPLLGSIRDYDGGATDMHIGPMTFYLAYCDHVVVYRFAPRAIDKADCEITWLVRGDAVEGRDYKLDELIWLWDVTTIADKTIIEGNAAGVGSRYYEPGPYSAMEDFTRRFVTWYLDIMKH